MLSGTNALDRLDFGNLASESAHDFDPGVSVSNLPLLGTATVGASAGLTYRDPTTGAAMTFTLAVDSVKQDYFTVKLWGNDAAENVNLDDGNGNLLYNLEETGGPVIYPNRFYYYTYAIPYSMTQGQTSLQLQLSIVAPGKPVYSVFTSTDPLFQPDSNDATGTSPTVTGQPTLSALTATQAINILEANRQSIYNTGNYYDQVLARQVIALNSTPNSDGTYSWSAPTGAPLEVVGLDLFTNLASWMAANPSATADTWRQRIAHQNAGPGYTAFPDELLTVLTSTYRMVPFTDANGNPVTGAGTLDHYHDPTILARIVAAIDGASYEQDSDGGFIQQGNSAAANSAWTGLTSTARTVGIYTGLTSREPTVHGGGDLQGVDTYALGWALIQLMNDATAWPILQTYLNKSYDADLNGGSMLRATAWERMLYNVVQFYQTATGGTESQNSFQETAMYAENIALEKLQAAFPNSSYPANESTALRYVKELLGVVPQSQTAPDMRGTGYGPATSNTPPVPNYGLTSLGFGEAHGAISTGFDGGGYGQIIPWLVPRVAILSTWDPGADAATVAALKQVANTTINSFDHFLSPLENATINSSGAVTADTYAFAEETYITYRDVKNINFEANRDNFNPQFLAADPNGPLDNAYALRAVYLTTQYGFTPSTVSDSGHGNSGGALNYLRDLASYESTVRSLINVNPATLTPLPAEPGQPDYVLADVQGGAVAIVNHGEKLFVNVDWRNYEYNNNSFTNLVPSQQLRYDYWTPTIQRGGQVLLPYNTATTQSDGNLSATVMDGVDVARLGNYLIVLNNSTDAYSAKLPVGVGTAEDLVSHNLFPLSSSSSSPTTISVAAGQAAVFWLGASSVVSSLGSGLDVGAVGTVGSDNYAGGVYTVSGAGGNIGGTLDAFHFVPTAVSGNATIAAQILSQTNTNSLAQAGVMVRDGTTADGALAGVFLTPGNGVMFEYRTTAGAAAAWVAVPTPLAAVYAKLTRSGNSISGWYSADGINWTQIGTAQTITLPTAAEIGLAVSSHNTAALSTATFGNLTVCSAVSPTVVTAAAASATTVTTSSVNLSVLGADAGGEAGLTYTWAVNGAAADSVSFSANGTNAAKNTTAMFAAAGTYAFRVYIKNGSGAVATSDVTVNVVPTATSMSIAAGLGLLTVGATRQYYATELDQFAMPLESPQPIAWSLNNGSSGSIDAFGLYTASAAGTATVRATYGSLSATASVTVQAAIGIFNATQDIGAPTPAGSASYNNSTGVYTVSGSGSDVYGAGGDQFRYVYIPVTGDATITAQVTSVSNTNAWTKAGVMFRDSLNANGAYAFMFATPTTSEGIAYQYRSSDGAGAAQNNQTTGTGTAPPQWVRIVRSGNTCAAYQSSNGTSWTQYGTTLTITMGSTIYVGLAVCSHSSGNWATATFANVALVTATHSVVPYDTAVGGATGSYSESGSTVTITGTGSDIWGTADGFYFGYNTISGNTTVTARVVSISATNSGAKAGVMVRDGVDPSAANMYAGITPSGIIHAGYRTVAGGSSSETNVSPYATPYWLRVTRSGNSLSAYRSPDGSTWTQVGSTRTITMNSTVYVGLVVSGLSASATAVFDNVSVTGTPNVGPTVATAAAVSQNPVTAATATLSVLGSDPDAPESNLTYTWAPLGLMPGNVTFSANGTNAAKNTVATFTRPGNYAFRVTITDFGGLSTTSTVSNVAVNQTFTSVAVSPATPTLGPGASQTFAAVALDQFGQAMASQPGFTWSLVSGAGSINSGSGAYSAPASIASGTATVRATSGSISGTAAVTIKNQAPFVQNSAGATASPATVSGTTTNLAVLGGDDGGESNLTYTWAAAGPGIVTYSASGTNAAKNTTATFSRAGSYTFYVTIADQGGLSTASSVGVTVQQTLSNLGLTPASANITVGSTQQFTATAYDQFNQPMSPQPAVTWWLVPVSAPGYLSSSGLYTPPYANGSAIVQATSDPQAGTPFSGTATVTFSGQAQWNASAIASWNAGGSWKDSISGATLATPGTRGIAGDTVLFASATGRVARLDGASPTLAGMTFDNATTSYTVSQGSGGSLTLQGSSGATVSVLAGNHAISAPLHLASNTTVNAATASTMTIGGPIDGGGSLTKTGGGTLVLDAANGFTGGLIVQAGKVVVSVANGLLDGSSLTVGAAGLFNSPRLAAAAAILSDISMVASASTVSPAKSLSSRAVAAVMAPGPPAPLVPQKVRYASGVLFPTVPPANVPATVKESWWRM